MARLVFMVGTGFTKHNQPIPYAVACDLNKQAVLYLTRLYGGVFFTEGDGAWLSPGNELITERSSRFEVEGYAGSNATEAGEFLRVLFNQLTVIASVSQSEVSFVTEELYREQTQTPYATPTQATSENLRGETSLRLSSACG